MLVSPIFITRSVAASGQSIFSVEDAITTSGGELTFTVWRKNFDRPASVNYVAGASSGSLVFAAFEIWRTVTIANATIDETCTLSQPSSGSTIEQGTGQGTVQAGTIYYISATGSDGADGLTTSTPKAITSLLTLATGSQPGRMVLLKRGDTMVSAALTLGFGTIANPLIIGAYGSGNNPIVECSGTNMQLSQSATGIDKAVIIQDIDFRPQSGVDPVRVFLQNYVTSSPAAGSTTIQRCSVEGNGANKFDIGFQSNVPYSTGLTMQFCTLSNINEFGILVNYPTVGEPAASDVVVRGNEVSLTGTDTVQDWGMYIGGTSVSIHANYIHDCIQSMKLRATQGLDLRWNYMRATNARVNCGPGGMNGVDGVGDGLPLSNAVIKNNVLTGCGGFYFSEADSSDLGPHCLENVIATENIITIDSANPTGAALGTPLIVATQYCESVNLAGNTVTISAALGYPISNIATPQLIDPVVI